MLIGILNCATFRIHNVKQLNFKDKYSYSNLALVDFRPGRQKSLNKIEKNIPLDKPILLSGSLCPNKEDIKQLGEKMNRIVDSLSNRKFIKVTLLDYSVKLLPDRNLKIAKNAALAAGAAGLILQGYEAYKENESFSCLMYPIYMAIPYNPISTFAIGLTISSTLALQLLPVVKRKTETVISVKINAQEDKLNVQHTENFSFGGKWKKYRVRKDGEVFWGVDIEKIREITKNAEDDFLAKFSDHVSKL